MTGDWIDVLGSTEIGSGEIRSVSLGDEDLVVWRTAGGDLCAMEARCPHQWSHLGAEGVVDGDEIVCTAHFWRFDVTGHGCKMAMSGRRDPKADIATFACREVDDRIQVRPSTPDDADGGTL